MKRIISGILTVVLIATMSITNFAQGAATNAGVQQYEGGLTVRTLIDDANTRKVQSSDKTHSTIATYDKVNRTITYEVRDLKKNSAPEVYKAYLNATKKAKETSEQGNSDRVTTLASIYQNTFSNYEYTKWINTTNTWELRRPDDSSFNGCYYFQTAETSSNKTYLASFKTNVDKLNGIEFDLIISGGAYMFADLLLALAAAGTGATAGLLSPTVVAAAATALGANGVYVANVIKLNTCINDCYNDYYEVWYHKS